MTAGYDGLLPVQQAWFDRLMDMPMRDWPPRLKEYITAAGGFGCGDEAAHLVGQWVKEQRD